MSNPVASIVRAAVRKKGEPLNIISFPTHERYQSGLAKCNANFYLLRAAGIKDWTTKYAPLPDNHILLDPNKGDKQLPLEVDFDLVLSQNKFGQFQWAQELSRRYHLPLVSLEHTLPVPQWGRKRREALLQMRGHINVFISEFSRKEWGFNDQDALIVHHGVDTDLFSPNDLVVDKKQHVLSVVNDWANRDWCMPAGQKILTTRGYVPVEKLKVGMEVLTDDGTPHPITKTFVRDYFGDMVVVRLDQDTELRFTPTHAIRVLRDGQWKYVEASRVRAGDTLRFPEHRQTDFSFNDEEYAWLIGLIVGDGSVNESGSLSIAFHTDERERAEKALSVLNRWIGNGNISERYRSRGQNAITVDATARVFCEWLRPHIGGKSAEKRLPDFIMRGSLPVRLAALRGLWAADGSFKNGKGHSPRGCFSTISPCLAAQVSELLMSFGAKCSVRRFKRTTNKSNGQVVPIYRVVAYGKDNVERCRRIIESARWDELHCAFRPVVQDVRVEEEWAGKVYNCEVADDHSYVVAPGFVAHNCCGFSLWREAAKGLPVFVVGDTPGLSKPAASIPELVMRYREAQVFINTSLISPVPTALLEAMSCGCPVVSTATCMIPEVIQHGVNGFMSNDPRELGEYCRILLADEKLREQMGAAARQTILDRFSMGKFVANWNRVFEQAANIVFTG